MDTESILNLFDSFWFSTNLLKIQSLQTQLPQIEQIPPISRQLTIHTRSKSDQFSTNPISPNSVLYPPHLDSGKECSIGIPKTPALKHPNTGFGDRRLSKSLSELEFDEVTGFMDLGFVFSEEDKEDSDLVEMLPGLQRLGRDEIGPVDVGARGRSFLSEAWLRKHEEDEMERWIVNWRLPYNEVDMKDSLKWWAHNVATVAATR